MDPYDKFGFHDSNIVSLALSKKHFEMILNDVFTTKGKVNAVLSIASVSQALIDHKAIDQLKMSGEFGDVLRLDIFENRISLLVEWIDFKPRKTSTHLYEIFGTDIQIKVLE
jgi:hypothetical protein